MSGKVFERSALILGASRGIGLGLVREYLVRGWQVIATQRQGGADSSLARLSESAQGALRVATTIAKHERQPGLVFVEYQDKAIAW